MTRTQKLELIKKYRPRLYSTLLRKVPFLVADPDNASQYDINIYNTLIEETAKKDRNNVTFRKNFSF